MPARSPTDAAIRAEVETITAIESFLNLPRNRHGATVKQIAEGTGLAEGRVREVLLKSECAIMQRPIKRHIWYLDYSTIEEGWRPKPREKSARGRKPKIRPLVVCPHCSKALPPTRVKM